MGGAGLPEEPPTPRRSFLDLRLPEIRGPHPTCSSLDLLPWVLVLLHLCHSPAGSGSAHTPSHPLQPLVGETQTSKPGVCGDDSWRPGVVPGALRLFSPSALTWLLSRNPVEWGAWLLTSAWPWCLSGRGREVLASSLPCPRPAILRPVAPSAPPGPSALGLVSKGCIQGQLHPLLPECGLLVPTKPRRLIVMPDQQGCVPRGPPSPQRALGPSELHRGLNLNSGLLCFLGYPQCLGANT